MNQINADIAMLKTKVNTLLNEILSVEHTVDDLHNYDDATIKESITNLEIKLQEEIEQVRTDTDSIQNNLSGIENTSTKIAIKKSAKIELDNSVNDNKDGSSITMLPIQLLLLNKSDDVGMLNAIALDEIVSIENSNGIHITNLNLNHWIKIGNTKNDISDVNGLKITYDANGVKFSSFNDTKHATLNLT
jgi:hypothetical protein